MSSKNDIYYGLPINGFSLSGDEVEMTVFKSLEELKEYIMDECGDDSYDGVVFYKIIPMGALEHKSDYNLKHFGKK